MPIVAAGPLNDVMNPTLYSAEAGAAAAAMSAVDRLIIQRARLPLMGVLSSCWAEVAALGATACAPGRGLAIVCGTTALQDRPRYKTANYLKAKISMRDLSTVHLAEGR
jgi:hypothetical protein